MLTDSPNLQSYAAPAGAMVQNALITTEGVHCHECVERMAAVLRGMDGVLIASADLARERLAVRFDPARIDLSTLYERIELSGYRPCAAIED